MHVDVDKLSQDLQAYVFPRLVPPGVVASPDVRGLRDAQGPCREVPKGLRVYILLI